jgi:hypothetical protein
VKLTLEVSLPALYEYIYMFVADIQVSILVKVCHAFTPDYYEWEHTAQVIGFTFGVFSVTPGLISHHTC